jgi:hypothetical protein
MFRIHLVRPDWCFSEEEYNNRFVQRGFNNSGRGRGNDHNNRQGGNFHDANRRERNEPKQGAMPAPKNSGESTKKTGTVKEEE